MDHIALHLKDIYFGRKTGLLSARGGGFQKQLYFQDGSLIFVKTNVAEERLGEVLFRMKKIGREVYEAIPSLVRPDVMLGETLVKEGFLSQKDLYEAIVAQMTAVVLSLFSRFDIRLTFQVRSRFFEDSVEHEMRLPLLMAEGIRAMPFQPELAQFFDGKVPVAGLEGEPGVLTDDERALLARFDGRRRPDAIRAERGEDEATFWKKIYLLYCLNLLDLIEASFAVASNEADRRRDDVQSRLRAMEDLRARLPKMEDFEVLGVAPDAREDEIKKAYFKLARKFHPDLFGRQLDAGQRAGVDDVFDAITKAYRNLLRDRNIVSAGASRAAAAPEPKTAAAPRRAVAEKQANPETLYRQGKTLFNQGRFEEAIGLLDEAARLKDDKADYFLLLAMAQSKVPALSKRAEKSFFRAIELEAWNPEGLVGLGLLYRREGLRSRAKKQFEKALEIDADHKIARQELESMKDKPDSKKGLGGFLNKDLFGSKKK